MADAPLDAPADSDAEERHATWLELFFDLVAVAGVAMLSHVLAVQLDARSLGLYAVLFLSFWLTWTTFMLYGNIAGGGTHVARLLVGMFGLGVMAASVPGVAHALLEDGHAGRPLHVYAIAYVATRWLGSQSWQRGEILLDFPVAQHLAGTIPWIVSLWAHGPTVAWLWAGGVALDLVLMLLVSGDEMLERYQARFDEAVASSRRRRRGRPDAGEGPRLRGLSVDPLHLAERLGLFVIIVLGESVVQVVQAASGASAGQHTFGAGVGAFALLSAMFGLSLLHGHAGLPHLLPGRLSTRAEMGMHCLVTGDIATIAVVLAVVVQRGAEPLPGPDRWLLCGAVAAYFALGLLASVATRGFRPAASALWVGTGIAVPAALGLWAESLDGVWVVWALAAVLLVHLYAERDSAPRD
ncbi:MAG: low temperature requirement protein A [Nocardioidaceae bacterium]